MATISNNEIKIKYSLDTTDLANATALFDRLSAEDRQLLNDLKRLQAQLNATGQAGQAAGQNIGNTVRNTNKQFDLMGSAIKQIGGYMATYFSVQGLIRFTQAVVQTTIKMEALKKAIEFTSGSVSAGLANFKFLEEAAQKLGLPIQAAAEGFKSMSAAANRAGITFQDQQKMFLDLSRGMAALSMTAQDASLVFFGFGQLLSKNKVSAQELYHQIGERLPIAMQAAQIAAAKITGEVEVTSSQLIKLVEDGKLMSSEFAPAFTEAIGKIAGKSADIDTLGKNFTRLGNAWDKMLLTMGESTEGFWYMTTKFLTQAVTDLATVFRDWNSQLADTQRFEFQVTMARYKNASKEFLDLMIEQKEGELKLQELAVKTAEQIKGLKEDDVTIRNLERSQVELAGVKGQLDALLRLRTDLTKKTNKGLDDEDKGVKKLENKYKILINQQEALMQAEEDLIKSRTKAGTNQDILLIENRVKFNNIMLEIDQRAEFKKLELAKNNAVKRKALLQKDGEEEQEILRQVRFKAFAAETEYLEKTLDFIKENAKKRRQQLQTDEQNEIEDSKQNIDEQIKILTDKYNETRKIEGQSKDNLEILELNYQDAINKLTEEGNKNRLAIIQKYRALEKQQRIEADFEIRSVMVEAASIRNQALAKTDMERADIADEAAMTQIKIEKDKNIRLRQENLENSTLSLEQKKIANEKLEAQDVLLDAKLTEIVKNGEKRRLEYKLEIANKGFELMSQLSNDLTNLYIANLDREREALNQKYEADVRLADGNKQKLAQLAQEKARKEYEIELKQFKARQIMAVAEVIFKTAPEIARWISTGVLAPVAAIGLAAQAFAIGAILSQPPPVPPYKDGTKGRPHPGGPALVGEAGTEKVITTDGQVYFTPPMATLVDLPRGAQVIPNHALSRKELFMANALNQGRPINPGDNLGPKLDRIGGILETLPVHQVNMNEKGFEKFVRTPRRTTKILNNQFPVKH